jgi:hypothetical protein
MQWQLIPETTMHAFNINALLTMIAINKLTDRTRKNSRNDNSHLTPPSSPADVSILSDHGAKGGGGGTGNILTNCVNSGIAKR